MLPTRPVETASEKVVAPTASALLKYSCNWNWLGLREIKVSKSNQPSLFKSTKCVQSLTKSFPKVAAAPGQTLVLVTWHEQQRRSKPKVARE